MKYTKEEFTELVSKVIDDLMQPDDNGNRLPAPAFMLLALAAAKITSKLFDGEEEIEIITEEKNHDYSNK